MKNFLKQTFLISLVLSMTVFVFLRLIFYSLPIAITEDGIILLKTVLTGWVLVMIGKGVFEGLVLALEYGQVIVRNRVKEESINNLDFAEDNMEFARRA